jgi:hypothetical protein
MRHRLLADRGCGVHHRLLHDVGLPYRLRLRSSDALLRRRRWLGRNRLWHHGRLLRHSTLVNRVGLRHERIYRRGREYPGGDAG